MQIGLSFLQLRLQQQPVTIHSEGLPPDPGLYHFHNANLSGQDGITGKKNRREIEFTQIS